MAEHGEGKVKRKMSKYVFYDRNNDIIAVHNGFSADEKFKGNIDAGELVLDVSTKGRIRGIEIMNAADFFSSLNVSRDILENFSDIDFNASMNQNRIILELVFKANNRKIPAKIAVPLENPIVI